MLGFWLIFVLYFIAYFFRPKLQKIEYSKNIVHFLTLLFLCLLIGYRHEVGGDWYNYLDRPQNAFYKGFYSTILSSREPGYAFFNWLGGQFGDIYTVNLLCAFIFCLGLFSFANSQTRPYLAILVAVPYLIVVVAMGYTRQSVAIGFAMMAFSKQNLSNYKRYLFFIFCACLFHITAIVLMPLIVFSNSKNKLLMLFALGVLGFAVFLSFISASLDRLNAGYMLAEMESAGATIRVFMNALPAGLFLLFKNKFIMNPNEKKFWVNFSWCAIALVILLYTLPSSTVVDRLALYWIPLQLFVFSRVPDAFKGFVANKTYLLSLAIAIYSAVIMFVWLNYADHAFAWVPYRFYPLVWLFS